MVALTREDGHLVAESDGLRVVFDGTTGGIRTVINLRTDQALVDGTESLVSWRLTAPRTNMWLLPSGFMRPPTYAFDTIEPSGFEATVDGDSARLVWTTTRDGITVEATVRFGDDGGIELWPRVDVQGDQEPPLESAIRSSTRRRRCRVRQQRCPRVSGRKSRRLAGIVEPDRDLGSTR